MGNDNDNDDHHHHHDANYKMQMARITTQVTTHSRQYNGTYMMTLNCTFYETYRIWLPTLIQLPPITPLAT